MMTEGIVQEIGKGKGKIVYGSNVKAYKIAEFIGDYEDIGAGDLVVFNLQGSRALQVKLKRRKPGVAWKR